MRLSLMMRCPCSVEFKNPLNGGGGVLTIMSHPDRIVNNPGTWLRKNWIAKQILPSIFEALRFEALQIKCP
jgi:hypothetical protein